MKFISHQELGPPADVLRVEHASDGPLGAHEVRIEVQATPIHPANLLQISGHYGVAPELPATPGSEGAGKIIEVGAQAGPVRVGQRVFFAGGGTWRDRLVLPAARCVPLPEEGDIEQLSMAAVNPLTASLLLSRFVDLEPGEWLVQSAANSAVGVFLTQLAHARGLKTVNLVRRAELADELEALGADAIVLDGPDLARRVTEATGGAPVRLAVDCVAGSTFAALVDCLADGGTLVSYGAVSMQTPSLNVPSIIFRDVRVRGFWLAKWFETAPLEEQKAELGHVIARIAQGELSVKIDSRFALDDISAAVTRAAAGGREGKVLLTPNPS